MAVYHFNVNLKKFQASFLVLFVLPLLLPLVGGAGPVYFGQYSEQ